MTNINDNSYPKNNELLIRYANTNEDGYLELCSQKFIDIKNIDHATQVIADYFDDKYCPSDSIIITAQLWSGFVGEIVMHDLDSFTGKRYTKKELTA